MDGGVTANTVGGLELLFIENRQDLIRFVAARCGSRELAEDLMQDLWLKLSTQAIGPVANGRAYLFRMANNLVLDDLRGRHRAMTRDRSWIEADHIGDVLTEDRPDSSLPADEEIARRQEASVLERAIAALPPGAQRALRLHRLEERDQAEVARIMGISRSGVEKHLAVAMKHLRNSLADCGCLNHVASTSRADKKGSPRGFSSDDD